MTIILLPHEMEIFAGLKNVHDKDFCAGQICVMHNPINGDFRRLLLVWENNVKRYERVCEHGVTHPDPSQFAFWRATGQEQLGTHPCDRCCLDWEIESWMFD